MSVCFAASPPGAPLFPRGHLALSGDTFNCHNGGREPQASLMGGGCQTPHMRRTAQQQSYPPSLKADSTRLSEVLVYLYSTNLYVLSKFAESPGFLSGPLTRTAHCSDSTEDSESPGPLSQLVFLWDCVCLSALVFSMLKVIFQKLSQVSL